MTDSYQIRLVESKDDPVLDQVEPLLKDMYGYMSQHGLQKSLTDDGAKKWRTGVERTLGRLGTIAVAQSDGQLIGFSRGIVRLSPDHLGTEKIGFVDHTYVCPDWRGKGIGRRLFVLLEEWFGSKNVQTLELQVLCENERAIKAWTAMGFGPELIQMRKEIKRPI